jgi:bifunctional ADP-heptose synthase (sugar kinase/adenylyltransferase)
MILALGDNFFDKYLLGKVRGMSAEAPIPILDLEKELIFPGGVGNVVQNLQSLEVDCQPIYPSENIPIKNRLMVGDLQVARWDENDYCSPILPSDVSLLGGEEVDAIIVSDYGKGAISPELIEFLVAWEKPLFVDTKKNPLPWFGATDLTLFPNLSEYQRFKEIYDWFLQVLLKQGKDGMSWVEYGRVVLSSPSLVERVVSVNGAGDTVLAAFVLASSVYPFSTFTLPEKLQFCNAAAAVVCEKPFTSSVTMEEIVNYLE